MAPFIPSLFTTSPQLGIFMGFSDPLATSIVASAGYDFVIIDMEHNPLSAAGVTQTVHSVGAVSKGKCAPLVRVPSHAYVWLSGREAQFSVSYGRLRKYLRHQSVEYIKWTLDTGCPGLIIPMVQTHSDALAIVQRGRYPPLGERSFGPSRAAFAFDHLAGVVGGYLATAMEEALPGIALIPMLESKTGVENVEAILGVEGISGGFVGPFDLRFSLGLPGGEGEEEEFVNALRAVVAAGENLRKPVGLMAPSARAVRQGVEMGFTFVAYGGDSTLLGMAARQGVREGREAMGRGRL